MPRTNRTVSEIRHQVAHDTLAMITWVLVPLTGLCILSTGDNGVQPAHGALLALAILTLLVNGFKRKLSLNISMMLIITLYLVLGLVSLSLLGVSNTLGHTAGLSWLSLPPWLWTLVSISIASAPLVIGGLRFNGLLAQALTHSLLQSEEHETQLAGVRADVETQVAERTAELEDKASQLRMVLDNMSSGIFMIDRDLIIRAINQNMLNMLDLPASVAGIGKPFADIVRLRTNRGDYNDGDQAPLIAKRILKSKFDQPISFEDTNRKTGRTIQVSLSPSDSGYIVAALTDVTDHRRIEAALQESEAQYKDATRIAKLGHWVYDETEDKITYCSDVLAEIHGVSPPEYLKMVSSTEKDIQRVHPEDREIYRVAITNAQRDASSFDVEYRIIKPNGEIRHINEIGESVVDANGQLTHSRGTLQDVTDRKMTELALQKSEQLLKQQVIELKKREVKLEALTAELVALAENLEAAKQEMHHLANHDALTGLPSLRLCTDRMESTLAAARRNKTETAVMFIDLDDFKTVNDSMGHEAGDTVLKIVAKRLQASIRGSDTAARIGGDEFIVLLPETGDKDAAAKVAQNILAEISKPIPVEGDEAHIGCSIGIAISPDDGATAHELLRHADDSMYIIKKHGKNNFGFFS